VLRLFSPWSWRLLPIIVASSSGGSAIENGPPSTVRGGRFVGDCSWPVSDQSLTGLTTYTSVCSAISSASSTSCRRTDLYFQVSYACTLHVAASGGISLRREGAMRLTILINGCDPAVSHDYAGRREHRLAWPFRFQIECIKTKRCRSSSEWDRNASGRRLGRLYRFSSGFRGRVPRPFERRFEKALGRHI
jgi:hypothetical protein